MGVDAEIIVKAREQLDDEQVLDLARRLAEAIGPKHFMIGADPWSGPRHALKRVGCAACRNEYDDEGPCPFEGPGPHAVHFQDGDPVVFPGDVTVLRVNLWGRYYGVGYERGSFPILAAICDWLTRNCGDVYYGGDSSGVCVRPWSEIRESLFSHWCEVGGAPYFSAFDSDAAEYARVCALCDRSMVRHGWGQAFAIYSCMWCGRRDETGDSGKTWKCTRDKREIEGEETKARVAAGRPETAGGGA